VKKLIGPILVIALFLALPLAAEGKAMQPKVFDAMVLSYPSFDEQLAVGIPVSASAQPKIYEASGYPTQTIVSGALALSIPALEDQATATNQKFLQGINSLSKSMFALGLLGIRDTIILLLLIALVISRTKVLKALGLSKIAETSGDGAASGK